MLVLIISLACFYVVCAAVVVVGMRKAPYGFEDDRGFHSTGEMASPRCEIGSENPESDREIKGGISDCGMPAPLRGGRRTSRIRRRHVRGTSKKRTQLWKAFISPGVGMTPPR
jgi:hypothetical protein